MEYQYLDQTQGSVEIHIQLPASPSCFPVAGSDGKGTSVVIENWNEISEKEQEVSWRRISKRNEERRKVLLEKMQQDSGDGRWVALL